MPAIEGSRTSGVSLVGASPLGLHPLTLIPTGTMRAHYLGSFLVKPGQAAVHLASPATVVDNVKLLIQQWLGEKLDTPRHSGNSELFSAGSRLLRSGDTFCEMVFIHPSELGPPKKAYSAFALEEGDKESAGRRWRTEIIVQALANDRARVHVSVLHGVPQGYVGPEPEVPRPSVPRFVRRLIENERIACEFDGIKVSQQSLAVNDTLESAAAFCKHLVHPERIGCVVLINRIAAGSGHGSHCVWNPDLIRSVCLGSGTVVIAATPLSVEGPFLSHVSQVLGPEFTHGIADGGLRLFQPGLNPKDRRDHLRHRYFLRDESVDSVPVWIRDAVIRSVKNHADRTKSPTYHGIFGINDAVQRDRRVADLSQQVVAVMQRTDQHVAQQQSELAALRALVEELQQGSTQLRGANEDLQRQLGTAVVDGRAAEELLVGADAEMKHLHRELEAANEARHRAEAEAATFRQKLLAKQLATAELMVPGLLPVSPTEAVTQLQKLLKPRIVILDHAIATAEYLPESRTKDVWRLLVSLHKDLWPLHFADTSGTAAPIREHTIPEVFTNETGIAYSVNESAQTQKNARLVRERQYIHEGVEYDFSAHLKVGERRHDALRVHFAVDKVNQRILVYHCGLHLETAGTKRNAAH